MIPRRDPTRILAYAGIFVLLVVVVPAGFGIWLFQTTVSFVGRSVSATGQVVDLQSAKFKSGYHTVYEFRDQSEVVHRIVESWSSSPPSHEIGETVEVLYDPQDPSGARLNGFVSLWLAPLLCGAATVLDIGFGLILLLPAIRKRRAAAKT